MMVTDLRCRLQNRYAGDFFSYVGGFFQCIKSDTSKFVTNTDVCMSGRLTFFRNFNLSFMETSSKFHLDNKSGHKLNRFLKNPSSLEIGLDEFSRKRSVSCP